jgi:general secretion pathway protein D
MKITISIAILISTFTVLSYSQNKPRQATEDPLQQREIVRKKEAVFAAVKSLESATIKEKTGDLIEAFDLFVSAAQVFQTTPQAEPYYQQAINGILRIGEKLFEEAKEKGNLELGSKVINQLSAFHGNNPQLSEMKKTLETALSNPGEGDFKVNPAVTEEFKAKVESVQRLLIEAEQFRRTGQYDEAEKRYKKIIQIDAYNLAAQQGLEKVFNEKHEFAKQYKEMSRERSLLELRERWAEPYRKSEYDEAVMENLMPMTRSVRFDTARKLKSIIIPSLNFNDAGIDEVAAFLNAKSRELDPDKIGINFIVQPEAAVSSSPITLNLNNIPLDEAVRYISQIGNVKTRIEEFGVLIVPLSAATDVLIRRSFNVPPNLFPATSGEELSTNTSGERRRTPTAANRSNVRVAGNQDVQKFLESQGVEFPDRASAVYIPASGILQVFNTQEQIDLIEELVNAVSGQTLVVEVETKFIEINQEDLRDLSFNYSLDPRFSFLEEITKGKTQGRLYVPSAQTALRGSQGFSQDNLDSILGRRTLPNPHRFDVAGFLNGRFYSAVITALNQKRSTDVLVSPSLRVKNGEDANINISRTFYYPTEFEKPRTISIPLNTTGNLVEGPAVVVPTFPTAFEKRDVGIKMNIKPQVGADNRTIDLSLFPELTEFEGFINYGDPIFIPSRRGPVLLSENKIEQPVFNTRRVNTKVLNRDGYTVVLGGLLREDVQKVSDKIPGLGDLPLVGRLFRSEAEKSQKKNLLIFVTTRILRPDGEPYNQIDLGQVSRSLSQN